MFDLNLGLNRWSRIILKWIVWFSMSKFYFLPKKKILEMFVCVEYFLPAKGTILLPEVVLWEHVNCTMHLKDWLKILDFCWHLSSGLLLAFTQKGPSFALQRQRVSMHYPAMHTHASCWGISEINWWVP